MSCRSTIVRQVKTKRILNILCNCAGLTLQMSEGSHIARITIAAILGLIGFTSSAQVQLDIVELSNGGHWLIFRHANAAGRASRDCDRKPPPTKRLCGRKAVLTKKGIEEAIHIRSALFDNNNRNFASIDTIYSSSCSRTLETARLIAGDAAVVKPFDSLRIRNEQASDNLLELVRTEKVSQGENILVVAHSTVIADAFGIGLDYADALVIESGSTSPKGRINAEEWPRNTNVEASVNTYCN